MSSGTVDHYKHQDHLQLESLPLIDLRLLSQSELLSLCSSSSSPSLSDEDVLTPKIDRSVFNESAGSRKQTFSRLRLAPRHHHHPSPPKPLSPPPSSIPQSLHRENSQILFLLRSLFSLDSLPKENDNKTEQEEEEEQQHHLFPVHIEYNNTNAIACETVQNIPVGVVNCTGRKRKRGRPRKNEMWCNDWVIESENSDSEALPITHHEGLKEVMMENRDGVAVDLVALGNVEDPFGEELRKRTQGMETADELLGFLRGLRGEWVSRREKRKIVDAADFGNVLPRGWKLMLCIKKKAGCVWVACRRYLSPHGQQFVSCKEVSSCLLSFFGPEGANQPNSSHTDDSVLLYDKLTLGNSADHMHKDDEEGASLVCCSQLAIASVSTEQEKPGTLLNIGSPGDVQKGGTLKADTVVETYTHKNSEYNFVPCDEQAMKADKNDETLLEDFDKCSVCNLANDKVQKLNAETDATAAELFVCSGVKTISSNYQNSSICGSSDEKCTVNVINNFVRQETSQKYSLAPSQSDQACVVDNNMNGTSISSLSKDKQEIGTESVHVASNEKAFSYGNIEDRLFTSTLEKMEINDGNNLVGDESMSGFDNSCTRQEDIRQQRSSEGCSLVPSGTEQRCGPINNKNVILTTFSSESVQRSGSQIILNSASKDKQASCVNNNWRFESSTLDELKFDGVNNSGRNELTVGFASSNTIKDSEGGSGCDELTVSFGSNNVTKDSEGGLLTLFGSEQTFDDNKVSSGTLEVDKLDQVQSPKKFLVVGSSDTELEPVTSSIKQEISTRGCLFVSSINELKIALENKHLNNSTLEDHKQDKLSESWLCKPSDNEQTCDDESNVNRDSCITMEDSNHKVKSFLIGNNHTGPDADVLTATAHESCSPTFSGNEKIFSSKNSIPGLCSSTMDELKQKTGSAQSLFCRNNESMIGFGNHSQTGEYIMAELLWKSEEENAPPSGLTDSSCRLLQSSGSFPSFDITSDKGSNELFSVGEKYDSLSGFEGLRSASIEHMEYNVTDQAASHSEESNISSYDAVMPQGFDSPVWFEKEALPLLPKIASRHQVATVCAWCGKEFHYEAVDYGVEAGSVGVLCAACKAKFSGDST